MECLEHHPRPQGLFFPSLCSGKKCQLSSFRDFLGGKVLGEKNSPGMGKRSKFEIFLNMPQFWTEKSLGGDKID